LKSEIKGLKRLPSAAEAWGSVLWWSREAAHEDGWNSWGSSSYFRV